MKIVIQEVYTVSDKSTRHPRHYRTLSGAMSRIAWWLIFDKYSTTYDHDLTDILNPTVIEKLPPHYDCECGEGDPYNNVYGWEDCPIHDRETGYFRRLHDRLTTFLVAKYASEEYPLSFGPGKMLAGDAT